MEPRRQGDIEADLEKLAKAESTEAFQFFKDALHKMLVRDIELLIMSDARSPEEEHDALTRARSYFLMLNTMPGKRWSLYQEWIDLLAKAEAAHENRFKGRNAKLIKRYEDWKRQASGG